jgi:site-specific DNA-methyltransferase (adenine-specific)
MRNQVLHCDCLDGFRSLPDESIPMILTSPPYDAMRQYGGGGWTWDTFAAVADQLWRVTRPGGVVAWVVQDSIVDGGESGTSDAQKARFRALGFRVYQTIYVVTDSHRRSPGRYYRQTSLAVVLSKGRPRTARPLADRPNATAGQVNRLAHRKRYGSIVRRPAMPVRAHGVRGTHGPSRWVGARVTKDLYAFEHSALMPESLAGDLVRSWSLPGDMVLDPMCGAATTCKMALLNDRDYLGFEVHGPYHRLAVRRMQDAHDLYRRRLDDWLGTGPSPVVRRGHTVGGYEVIHADPPRP